MVLIRLSTESVIPSGIGARPPQYDVLKPSNLKPSKVRSEFVPKAGVQRSRGTALSSFRQGRLAAAAASPFHQPLLDRAERPAEHSPKRVPQCRRFRAGMPLLAKSGGLRDR